MMRSVIRFSDKHVAPAQPLQHECNTARANTIIVAEHQPGIPGGDMPVDVVDELPAGHVPGAGDMTGLMFSLAPHIEAHRRSIKIAAQMLEFGTAEALNTHRLSNVVCARQQLIT